MRLSETRSRRFFWEPQDRGFIVATVTRDWPDEVKEVLHRADQACERTFIFTHRWDMERCETEVSFPDGIDWTYRYRGDIEWMVMLNRARYMSELGQAYWLTGDEKYVQGFIALMKDWLKQNPLTEEEVRASADRAYNVKDTWRKLDSGIRIANWLKGYHCVKISALWRDEEETLFREAVKLHGMYLNIAYTPHDTQSNWGFLETNGLFQIALLYPEFEASRAWLDTAVKRLTEMCRVQVFEDGMHNEQCTMYHHEVLHCLFEPVLLAELNECELPAELKRTLQRMYTASLALVQPDGRQPMLGDSDGTDIRDVLSRGAVLFGRGDLKKMGYGTLDYEGIWFFGVTGYERYARLQAANPAFDSLELPQSGYAVMRTGWTPEAGYMLFDAGHMDAIRAHGHDDLLHISLFAGGREFLTDPGRFTYMENEFRRYFKESLQHNTVSVDGETISTYLDSWKWANVANPLDRGWLATDHFDYAQGCHDGYFKLGDPVQVRRQILFVKPDYWIVVDTCRSRGEHFYALPFHFAEDLEVRLGADGSVTAEANDSESLLRIIPVMPTDVKIESAWVSRHYNRKVPSVKAVFTQKGYGLTRFVSILYPQKRREEQAPQIEAIEVLDSYGHPVPSDKVTAIFVRRGEKRDYVVFSHQGVCGYRFAGSHLTGEVLFVKQDGEKGKAQSYVVKV
ncbi:MULTISPECIES: alginate lyase family protein [Paenibacillus]|uniref:alginate lyase family protein n=1 Tax=Paenibacillus TaxID=44249 RepID=UPI002FE00042